MGSEETRYWLMNGAPQDIKIELGSINKGDFQNLTQWIPAWQHQNFGIATRLGIKAVRDTQGKPYRALLFWAQYMIKFGYSSQREEEKRACKHLENTIHHTEEYLRKNYPGEILLSLLLNPPPAWMQRELQELIHG